MTTPAEPPAALVAALLGRSVTRRFGPEAIPGRLRNTVLAAAQPAPTESDLQQHAIVVLTEPAAIAAIAGWIGTMPWIAGSPAFLLICADLRRNRDSCGREGRAHAALAMGSCGAAAEHAGLGSCPVSHVRDHLDRVAGLSGLPPGVFPVAGLAFGWPAAREPVSARLPPEREHGVPARRARAGRPPRLAAAARLRA